MKAFTSLEQSKKLTEILLLESADMCWYIDDNNIPTHTPDNGFYRQDKNHIPCYSLAALLDVLESEINSEDGETYQLRIEKDGTLWNVWYKEQYDEANLIETNSTEELVDACYEMILKLHELKML